MILSPDPTAPETLSLLDIAAWQFKDLAVKKTRIIAGIPSIQRGAVWNAGQVELFGIQFSEDSQSVHWLCARNSPHKKRTAENMEVDGTRRISPVTCSMVNNGVMRLRSAF